MSTTVDNRVVSMQFDNAEFERKTKTTMSTLDRLKQKLNFGDSAKSLQNLGKTAGAVNMSPLEQSVGIIANRFTTLGVVATTALQRIANAAITTGTNMVRSLTIDPLIAGLNEYETKMGSITTILTNTSSKGTTLDQVNATLQELNTYADETIYNFGQMTENIGRFTAAGVDLDTSATAIKGIANLAAASGSNAQQAASAMYQLSQAIASGTVRLQDWISVENAGMGGEMFQNALIDTARKHGVAIDELIAKYGSFRYTLTETGWLTSEILTETLSHFTGDLTKQELMAQGYTEAQADEIVKLGELAKSAATEVKTLTQLFGTMAESLGSGWAQSWEYIIGDTEEATKTLTSIKDAFESIIGPVTQARNEMLKFWNENGGREAVIEGLANVFKGLGNILKPIGEAFRNVFPPMTGEKLVEISESFRDLTENFKIGEGTITNIQRIFETLFSVLGMGKDAIVFVATNFSKLFGILGNLGGAGLQVLAALADQISKLPNAFDKVVDFFSTGDIIGKFANGIETAINSISGFLGNLIDSLSFDSVMDAVNSGLLAGLLVSIGTFIKKLKKSFGGMKEIGEQLGFFSELKSNITDILDSVKSSLEAFQNDLKANTLLKIAAAIGILAISLKTLGTLNAEQTGNALSAITVLFAELMISMSAFTKIIDGKALTNMGRVSIAMLLMSTSVLVLAQAMKSLSSLNWSEIAKGLTSVAGLMTILVIASKGLSGSTGKLISTSVGLVIFASAIAGLVNSVKELSSLNVEELTKGLVGMGILVVELAAFLKMADFDKFGVMKGVGLMAVAASLIILSNAVKTMSSIDTESLIKGLSSVGIILSELSIFLQTTKSAKGVITTATGMVILGGAILILSNGVAALAKIPTNQLVKGLVGMASALAIIALAVRMIPKSTIVTAAGLVVLGGALHIITAAVQSMGGMSWEQIGKGMTVLGGSLAILAIGMHAMNGTLAGSAAMLVMAGALAVLTPSILALSNLSLASMGIALLTLAGAFTVFGAAGALLSPVIPSMLGVAAAIALLGIGVLAAGAGITMLATGIAALAAAVTGGGVAIIAGIRMIILAAADLIPELATQFANGIVAFAETIAAGAPVIGEAFVAIVSTILETFTTLVPQIATAAMFLVTTLLTTLAESLPQIMQAGFNVIMAFLQGIANNIGGIVTSAITIVVNFINALAAQLPAIIQAGFNLMINFINGLSSAIVTNAPLVSSAVINLITSIIYAMGTFVSQFGEAGRSFITSLANGIGSMIQNAVSKAKEVGSAAANGIKGIAKDFVQAGRNAISGFIEGIGSLASQVVSKAKQIGGDALSAIKGALGIASPSKEFRKVGVYSDEGLIIGFKSLASKVAMAARKVGSGAKEAVVKGLADLDALLTTDVDPVIRPVVDLTDAEQKMKKFSRLFGDERFKMGADTDKVNRAITKKLPKPDPNDQPKPQAAGGNTTYSYVQNNYSPKALSRKEIYRQTKNQFSSMKKRIGA